MFARDDRWILHRVPEDNPPHAPASYFKACWDQNRKSSLWSVCHCSLSYQLGHRIAQICTWKSESCLGEGEFNCWLTSSIPTATAASSSSIRILAIPSVPSICRLCIGLRVGPWEASKSTPRESAVPSITSTKGCWSAKALIAKPWVATIPCWAPGTAPSCPYCKIVRLQRQWLKQQKWILWT